MIAVKDKIRFLQGLFAKYVLALVGLVVFVLAVNGALETWISYRATKTTLTDAMSEKARGDQQADRAIDLRPRTPDQLGDPRQRGDAGAAPRRLRATAQRRARGQPALAAERPGPRTAAAVTHLDPDQRRRGFLPRHALYRDRFPRRQLRAGLFPWLAALHVDLGVAFRFQRRRHRRRYRSALPVRLPRRRPGRQGHFRLCDGFPRPGAGDLGQGPRHRRRFVEPAAGRRDDLADRRADRFRHRRHKSFGADRGRRRAANSAGTCFSSSRPRRRWRRSGTSWCGSRF